MHNGNFDDDLTCHELYAYGNDRSDDPIPEQKYCKLTADFNSDSYRKLLNEFNGGKTDIAAEYSIVNGNEIIGSIAAVREKRRSRNIPSVFSTSCPSSLSVSIPRS